MCEAIDVLSPLQRPILKSVPFPPSLFQNGHYELAMGAWLDHQASSSWLLTCGHPDSLEVRTGDMSLHAMCLGLNAQVLLASSLQLEKNSQQRVFLGTPPPQT